jgi:hypothetical protein
MSDLRRRLSDDELQGTEDDLRASLQYLHEKTTSSANDPLLESAIAIGLNLVEAVRHERKLIQYPVHSAIEDENAALRELINALVPVAKVAESLWGELAQSDPRYIDLQQRHKTMSKLGGALRTFRMVMANMEHRSNAVPLKNVA